MMCKSTWMTDITRALLPMSTETTSVYVLSALPRCSLRHSSLSFILGTFPLLTSGARNSLYPSSPVLAVCLPATNVWTHDPWKILSALFRQGLLCFLKKGWYMHSKLARFLPPLLTFEVSVKVFGHLGRKVALSYIILSYNKFDYLVGINVFIILKCL